MNVYVDFDELSIHVLNGLGPAYLNIFDALQVWETLVTFEELFKQLLRYEDIMKILVPSSLAASTPAISLVAWTCPSSHHRSNNRDGWNYNQSQQS